MWSPGVYIVYLPTQLVTQQDTDQEGDHKNQQSQKGNQSHAHIHLFYNKHSTIPKSTKSLKYVTQIKSKIMKETFI